VLHHIFFLQFWNSWTTCFWNSGQNEAGQQHGLLVPLISFTLHFYLWGHLQSTVCATAVSDMQSTFRATAVSDICSLLFVLQQSVTYAVNCSCYSSQWHLQSAVCATAVSDICSQLFVLQQSVTSAVNCSCYSSQWHPGLATSTEWTSDDSHDTWNFRVSLAITTKSCFAVQSGYLAFPVTRKPCFIRPIVM
jgi:hypothetical protein